MMIAKLRQVLRSRKTQNILLGAAFVFLLSFGLARPAMANLASDIGQGFINSILGGLGFILGVIYNMLGSLTGLFLGVAVLIFNWVSSPGFISLSYTNAGLSPTDPNFNQFVGVGWELTRSLANIVFVVALVAIGIGTALRISGYQAQQALKNLIVIALLVNFTPVIAGVIIDASNIVMGFFINPNGSTAGQIIWQKTTSQWANMSQLVPGAGGNMPWNAAGGPQAFAAAMGALALIWFNLIAGIIYFLFAALFILRYIALWLLVIFSPFAFVCYILPYTRGVWSQWWKMFIQWSILGIIAGFFLYLSEHIYNAFNSASFKTMEDLSAAPGLAPLFNGLLPSVIPIFLLFWGLIASIAGAPSAAQGILRGGQKMATFVAKKAPSISWKTTKATVATATAIPRSFTQGMKTGGGWTTRSGWASGFNSAKKTATPPSPKQWVPLAKGYVKAAGKGLKKAASDIYKAGYSKKAPKPKKTKQCPSCNIWLDDADAFCKACGHVF